MSKLHVLLGPLRLAMRYVRRRGWNAQDVIVVSDAAALHAIDPPLIRSIIVLGRRVVGKVWHELQCLRSLWKVRIVQVANPT